MKEVQDFFFFPGMIMKSIRYIAGNCILPATWNKDKCI